LRSAHTAPADGARAGSAGFACDPPTVGPSALGRRWRADAPTLRGIGAAAATDTGRGSGGVDPVLAAMVARRGHGDPERFLAPTLRREMPEPFSVPGMEGAAKLIAEAVRRRDRIGIIGDYDVDGATSTAILVRWARAAGCPEPLVHIPQRLTEGYGPNTPAVESLAARGAGLLVIADSGTARGAFGPIARARELGLPVVVLDHHEPEEDGSLPDAVVCNPKLSPETDRPHAYLCTAGLCVLALVAVARELRRDGWWESKGIAEPRLVGQIMGLAALGTVADMVPLVGMNRAVLAAGLGRMEENPGIAALARAVGMDRAGEADPVRTAGFVYGPCINAGGRIGDTGQGWRLLAEDDPDACDAMAAALHRQNLRRREIQEEMLAACAEMAEARVGPGARTLVLYDPSWNPGVVGLAAARLKDRFDVSAVVIGEGGKGSGRATGGFHIGRAFQRAVDRGFLIKGGGHAAAGGLTADPARVGDLDRFLRDEAASQPPEPRATDLRLDIDELTAPLVSLLGAMAPFGAGNEEPRLVVTGGTVRRVALLQDKRTGQPRHVRAELRGRVGTAKIICFNAVGSPLGLALQALEGARADVLGFASVDPFSGRPQIKPVDLLPNPPPGLWESAAPETASPGGPLPAQAAGRGPAPFAAAASPPRV